MAKRLTSVLFTAAWVAVYAVLSVLVGWAVLQSGVYPQGVDTMCHIYKGEVLYGSILDGTWWPLYDPLWYNGVEMMRYWAPLPVYVLAGCQALAGGDPIMGYVVFTGIIFFAGALAWHFAGIRLKRRWLGSVVGILWFVTPSNLFALFWEGNLPRSICLALLPVFLYLVYSWQSKRDWRTLAVLAPWFSLMALCHAGYAGMVAIAYVLYWVVYGVFNRDFRSLLAPFAAMLAGYALIGLWLVPSLIGGITSSGSNAEIAADFFQPLLLTVNPLHRLEYGPYNFYFGFASLVLAAFGGFMAHRKAMPGFWAAIVIVVCTSSALYPALMALPGGGLLWMLRFLSIANALVLMSFLLWGSLRKALVVAFCVLLALDAVPSLPLVYGDLDGETFEERMDQYEDIFLVGQAQDLTTQRLALIDGSFLDAVSAYLVTGYRNPVATTYGAAWQSSTISTNFMNLDRSVQEGEFLYTFDRALELGDDTVLVRTTMVKDPVDDGYAAMDAAARRSGYELVDAAGVFRLYKLVGAPGQWGTISGYRAIVIGSNPGAVSLSFPAMQEGDSNNLDDYTFEELSAYDVVYITDFTYSDQQAAEDLVLRVSEAGTRVVITADGIPENRDTHDRIFCGVRCNTIVFSNGYPELDTIDGRLNCDLFPQGYTTWQTVYLEGLDERWGSIDEGDATFEFYGTARNDDLVFVGLNLTYHLSLTRDPVAKALLSHAMELSDVELPERAIVPVSVEYAADRITVTTDYDDVNTALARHDIFDAGDAPLREHNNLVYVDAGTTVIRMRYPYFWQGLAASAGGLALLVVLCAVAWRLYRPPRAGDDGRDEPAAGGGHADTAPRDAAADGEGDVAR